VAGDERLRLFLGYRLPADVVETTAEWQARHLRGRIVPAPNLHVTLAFLGRRPASDLPAIVDVLRRAAAESDTPRFEVSGYRETRSVGMLTLEDESGAASALAGRLHADLAALGVYEPEKRPWLAHVTVLRFGVRPGLEPVLPALAPFAPSDAAAFLSRLHPSGARYEVHDSFRLGG
jgi:RNA 2',3'-cyclic 3'-phosphodiesterase